MDWNLNSYLIESSQSKTSNIEKECKIRKLNYSYNYIKTNNFLNKIIEFKEFFIINNYTKKKYKYYGNKNKYLKFVFFLLLLIFVIKKLFLKSKRKYTFIYFSGGNIMFFDNFNPLNKLEKFSPPKIIISNLIRNFIKLVVDMISINLLITESE
tara:strand:+ start:132 stop:593 length:462 start_codon:yes stop_codon:yes gene_type:complete